MFDKLHICEVYYWYFSLTHEGQWSKKYQRLCKLTEYYKPSIFDCFENLSEEVKLDVEWLMNTKL